MTKLRAAAMALLVFILALIFSSQPTQAASNGDYLVRGAARTMVSTMEIPLTMINDSKHVMFPFGLVTGAIRGTFRTVLGMVAGATDLARGAAPYAKYAIFLA